MQQRLFSYINSIRVVGLLLAALAAWIFAEIAEDVLEKETYAFDQHILLQIRLLHTPILDKIMLAITWIGDPGVLIVASIGLAIWLVQQNHRFDATTLGIAAIGAVGLNYWLKVLFGRTRPALWNRIIDVGQYSFPSGHAMVSMVIYGLMGYILATRFRQWSGVIVAATLLLILAIGFSRMYLGVHWPTDIAAGYAAGLVWLITCIASLRSWRQYRSYRHHNLPGQQ